MKNTNKLIKFFIALSVFFSSTLLFGCLSSSVEIPYESTDREIIQLAQTEYDAGHTERALYCYNTLLKRYGNDTAIYVEGRYEIGHLYLKEKNYSMAEEIFEEIISIYDGSAPGTLPGAFKKLTELDLEKIPESKRTTKVSTAEAIN